MLKALELNGFKSFADKTRFEFPPGISVVVGPNGSGKSNIVDAMKWVLGEQSARSLRGKEMADVIFKGSGSGTRRPANTAEATIIFDNSEGLLGYDAAEVHVTRRVYRSGEGEYLINGQACRLRDIRDLFRGTGVGTDAYSIIEQGKVDMLLQATPRDRRAIFEEAAGISRFKAKKVEAQRRLERVDQNLLRLSDIVDEVDSRLRRLKSQATKARRYQEYTHRLQELRTQVGRVDWQRLSERLQTVEVELAELNDRAVCGSAEIESLEARRLELDSEWSAIAEELRSCEMRASRNRESMASHESTIRHQRSQTADLDDEIARCRRQLLAMNARADGLHSQLREITTSVANADSEHARELERLRSLERHLSEVTEKLAAARETSESRRQRYMDRMRENGELANQVAARRSMIEAAEATIARVSKQMADIAAALHDADEQFAALVQQRESLAEVRKVREQSLLSVRQDLTEGREQLGEIHEELADARQRSAVTGERVALLQELEARLEDVSAGVKYVIEQSRKDATGPFGGVRGMVADLIHVTDHDMASMIEVALGDRAQHLVVAGSRLIEHFERDGAELPGRVGLMRLESTPPTLQSRHVDLHGQSGVIGRADEFVEAAAEYRHLIGWLLGGTWIVDSLTDALQFRRSLNVPLRFATRSGELVEPDGRILVGPDRGRIGLISRRAELQSLTEAVGQLDARIEQQESQAAVLQEQIQVFEQRAAEISAAYDEVAAALAQTQVQEDVARERVGHFQQQQELISSESMAAQEKVEKGQSQLAAHVDCQHRVDVELKEIESQLRADSETIEELDDQRRQQDQQVTAARVQMAKSEQRLEAYRTQLAQLQRDQDERDRAVADTRAQLNRGQERLQQSEREILLATSELSELYLLDETNTAESTAMLARREAQRVEREGLSQQLNATRQRLQSVQQQQHLQELEGEKIRHERTTLAERLKEDYGIEVSDLQTQLTEEEQAAREEVDHEIAELRRKISNIGAVNMDALSELDELQSRYETLSTQHQDLVDAKESLERIIHSINADSRRLFSETLEAIRINFQALFRKVFGGGKADIVLEEGVDMLEGGIDIVATPPGKHSLGLSLLSGGERALTAVTLLLAIFEYRPSPFCVLDEVDGPLDEANIGRFVDVLNEFLKWTKFVVVTHSKKTMTAAHTLYGVTMQESGVSKRVSVRFEDVSEDGQIRQEALDRVGDSGEDERGAA